jgi:hypothetical protein
MGLETKNYYAGESQHQFNRLTDWLIYITGGSQSHQRIKFGNASIGLGTKSHCAGETQQQFSSQSLSQHRILEITCSLNIPYWILIWNTKFLIFTVT